MNAYSFVASMRSLKSCSRSLSNDSRRRLIDGIARLSKRVTPSCRTACHLTFSPSVSKRSVVENNKTRVPAVMGFHTSKSIEEKDTEFAVDISSEGTPLENDKQRIVDIASMLQDDAIVAMKALLRLHQCVGMLYLNKELVELSLVLSDDTYIHELNLKYLNEDRPTDVLSFPMDGGEDNQLPVMLLGDVIISLDMAERQAKQMKHTLLTECRILLVHGLLHLFGYDHDRSNRDWAEMAGLEKQVLAALGWNGTGLIADTKRMMMQQSDDNENLADTTRYLEDSSIRTKQAETTSKQGPTLVTATHKDEIQLVAVDMDGTLLTSDQRIEDSSRLAIQEALDMGIKVVVATGKARPGAMAVCQKYGLYGTKNLISHQSAGVFLQGLMVHTSTGEPIAGPNLSTDVVRSVFKYASLNDVSCVAFKGDDTLTLKNTPETIELHERYYEPLPREVRSVEELLSGEPVKKIILVADPERIGQELRPHWDTHLVGTGSQTVLAVSCHLELIPDGVNKWNGLETLLQSMNLTHQSCMAVGDGGNDYEMIRNVAIGVAMGNAVDKVKSVANFVVSTNDEGGIAEAFERFIL